jgi:hypothetical protein
MDLVQGIHLDYEAAIDLSLPKDSVSLAACSDFDAVPPAEPDHFGDVLDRAGTKYSDG